MSNEAVAGRPGRASAGVGVAIVLMLGSGVAYRSAADRLVQVRGGIKLPRGTLGALALEIGEWAGRDVALSDAVVSVTDTDDHVNRVYRRRGGREAISLFIGCGVRMRDLMPHRPEVCYPGSGWTLDETRRVELQTDEGIDLPCRIHRFYRGGIDSARTTVLNYYILDGEYYPDVSLLRSKAWKLEGDIEYAAQVQIAAGDPAWKAGEEAVSAFASESAALIRAVLTDAAARLKDGR